MRPSLIPGLLARLRETSAGRGERSIFELVEHFAATVRKTDVSHCSSPAKQRPTRTGVAHDKRRMDLYDFKGVIEAIRLGEPALFSRGAAESASARMAHAATKRSASPGSSAAQARRPSAPVIMAEIDFPNELHRPACKKFRELERFPSVSRDIAMIAPETLSHSEIYARCSEEPLLASSVFNLSAATGRKILERARKSLAYTLTYRDQNRTLTPDEVSAAHDRIRERLKRELGAELRE